MSLALTSATKEPLESPGTYSVVSTGKPPKVPPFMVMPGNSTWPSGLTIMLRASAVVEDMIHTPEVGALLAAMNEANNARISARTASASVPELGIAATPFRIDAGLIPATAALVGL